MSEGQTSYHGMPDIFFTVLGVSTLTVATLGMKSSLTQDTIRIGLVCHSVISLDAPCELVFINLKI